MGGGHKINLAGFNTAVSPGMDKQIQTTISQGRFLKSVAKS